MTEVCDCSKRTNLYLTISTWKFRDVLLSALFRSLLTKCDIKKEQIFINDHEQFGH